MQWYYYCSIGVLLAILIGVAFYSRRYVRDVADYLACGRVAGRYVISVGDLTSGLSVITFVAFCEQNYQCGIAMSFWETALSLQVGTFLSLTGYCVYRFRQTRCLSIGQFFEQRYSRSFRIVASALRAFTEMLTNAIGPAIAVRFFIYFLGLPHRVDLFGMSLPVYGLLVAGLLLIALLIIFPAGRVSLLITDSLQGLMSYPIFLVFTIFVLVNISWFSDTVPVMLDRAAGESFINPMDVSKLRDFNVFALIVTLTGTILNRAAWIGNDTTNSARNPHEQKMAGILGAWRNGFSSSALILFGIFVITFMLGDRFAPTAHEVRLALADRVAAEVVVEPDVRGRLDAAMASLEVPSHRIGVDEPYSRQQNPDTRLLDKAYQAMQSETTSQEVTNAGFQEFRSLYYQMMMPSMLRKLCPEILIALLTLLMVMLMISTDDSRIFNASSTLIQDIVMPLRKTPLTVKQHLLLLKLGSVFVAAFFFAVSLFFVQLDYINMFVTVMCSIWLGAAGPIMIGGLYTKFGTTTGAWCALVFGSGTAIVGMFLQRTWASLVYPLVADLGMVDQVDRLLRLISAPFAPYIDWHMDAIKFPINSFEIYFLAMFLGSAAYVAGSLLLRRRSYNLDRLLHRGIYSEEPEVRHSAWSCSNLYSKLIGIDDEYTCGDKIIAWSVFIFSFFYRFFLGFVVVLVWNMISPWSKDSWGMYFFITMILTSLAVGAISTVWFIWGGVCDTIALFRDLKKRIANPLDNGFVEGEISLADLAHVSQVEGEVSGKK
ncbi:MAG: hypothetical protein PHI35_05405 [Victivallaceae bacterium]|nr:hypothetical protein [Victivallaceae bacterium]